MVLFSMDLGTSKFCLAALVPSNNTTIFETVPSIGIKKGRIEDYASVGARIKDLLKLFCKKHPQLPLAKELMLSVSCAYTEERLITLDYTNQKKRRCVNNPAHYDQAMKQAAERFENFNSNVQSPSTLLHLVPFRCLSETNIHHACEFYCISMKSDAISDHIALFNHLGIKISHFYSNNFGMLQSPAVNNDSGFILDLGAGKVDGLVFINKKPIHMFTYPIGGNTFTSDLATGLEVSFNAAEDLKLSNLATLQFLGSSTLDFAQDILKARALELCSILKKELAPFIPIPGFNCAYLFGLSSFLQIFQNELEKTFPFFVINNLINADGESQHTGSQSLLALYKKIHQEKNAIKRPFISSTLLRPLTHWIDEFSNGKIHYTTAHPT